LAKLPSLHMTALLNGLSKPSHRYVSQSININPLQTGPATNWWKQVI